MDIFCSAQGKDYMVLPVAVCSLQQLFDAREEDVMRSSFASSRASSPRHASPINSFMNPVDGISDSRGDLDGGSFFCFTKKRLVPPGLSKDIVFQLLSGVEYMHRQGLHHNDIKPENILLFADGTVKLTDLGSVGKDFVGRGTPAYLSPQATGITEVDIDAAANDCWACGVLLYLLCTNRLPFSGTTEFALYNAINEQPVDLSHVLEKDGVSSLIQGLLEKDQRKRLTASQALQHPWLKTGVMTGSFRSNHTGDSSNPDAIRREIGAHNVRRIFNIKDIAEMIELDDARHRQFAHEVRHILGLPVPTKASKAEMTELLPLFLPQAEFLHYSRKNQPDNDVRSFRHDGLKLSSIATYCSLVIENGAKTAKPKSVESDGDEVVEKKKCCRCTVS